MTNVEDVNFLAPIQVLSNGAANVADAQHASHETATALVATCRLVGARMLRQETSRSSRPTSQDAFGSPEAPCSRQRATRLRRVGPVSTAMRSIGSISTVRPIRCSRRHGATTASLSAKCLSLPGNHVPDDASMILEPRLVGLCFQTAGVWQLGRTGRWACRCASTASRHRRRPKKKIRDDCTPSSRRAPGESFDAVVVDEAGTVFATMNGYRTAELPGDVDSAKRQPRERNGWNHEQGFQRIAIPQPRRGRHEVYRGRPQMERSTGDGLRTIARALHGVRSTFARSSDRRRRALVSDRRPSRRPAEKPSAPFRSRARQRGARERAEQMPCGPDGAPRPKMRHSSRCARPWASCSSDRTRARSRHSVIASRASCRRAPIFQRAAWSEGPSKPRGGRTTGRAHRLSARPQAPPRTRTTGRSDWPVEGRVRTRPPGGRTPPRANDARHGARGPRARHRGPKSPLMTTARSTGLRARCDASASRSQGLEEHRPQA